MKTNIIYRFFKTECETEFQQSSQIKTNHFKKIALVVDITDILGLLVVNTI